MAPTLDVHSDSSGDESPPPSPAPSVGEHVVPTRVGKFRLLAQHRLDVPPYTTIAKWESEDSGLKVVWADTPGPVANFWTTVCTEVFSSNGTPHTLEHATFTASEHYPYSGILDALSNRMLSAGTNAWTAVDNTTYTFESASAEGMLRIIPVFLDHILFPLITPEVFKTEIYHVDGKGEEGGVVFSEMQGREGSMGDVLDQSLRKILYGKHNAYGFETGGKLDALRKLSVQDIIDYHSDLYVPQNMTVIVTGHAIRPEQLLATLQQTIEPALAKAGLAKGPRPRGWVRPFVESHTAMNPPTLKRDIVEQVEYADSDESVGAVEISWLGPRVHDWRNNAALAVMWGYLVSGDTSPAAKKFVNIPESYCSGINLHTDFRDPNLFTTILSNVPAKHLGTLAALFLAFLKEQSLVPLDMSRMRDQLRQQRLELLETLENDAATYVQSSVLQDILYGAEDGSQFTDVFADLEMIETLQKYTEHDWLDILEDWIVKRPTVTIVARPSAELAEKQAAGTKARIAATRARLGTAGLARAAAGLEMSKKLNKHPAPQKLIESYQVPSLSSIGWLEVDTARSNGVARGRETFTGRLQRKVNAEDADVPYFIQFDHFASSFVQVSAFLHGPPAELFPLYLDSFFAMPVMREDGTRLSFEQVSRALDELTIGFSADIVGEGILVMIKVVKEHYEEAIAWLSDVIYGTQFDDIDRLTSLINSALQSLPAEKEDAAGVACAAAQNLLISAGSVNHTMSVINRAELYPRLHQRLQKDPQGLVKDLHAFQNQMLDPRSLRIKVSGNVMALDNPSTAWLTHFEHVLPFPADELSHMLRTRNLLTDLGEAPSRKGIVYAIPSSESNYLFTCAKSPDWTHADHPAIAVACACLSGTNSFLWDAVRGPGDAYGCWIKDNVEYGQLAFIVFKSPDALAAYEAGKRLIGDIVSRKTRITDTHIASAKSTLAFSLVSALEAPNDVADASFSNTVVLGRPQNYTSLMLKRIQAVTVDDVQRVIGKWIQPLFNSETSVVGATVAPAKRKELVDGLGKLGYEVTDSRL
ncbi:hypothetical protein JCM3770_002282 [Rhodotorula araucariae]